MEKGKSRNCTKINVFYKKVAIFPYLYGKSIQYKRLSRVIQIAKIGKFGRVNNKVNPNKNICAHKVASYLGVSNSVKFLHTEKDILRAVRKEFTAVRARFNVVPTISEIIAYYKQNVSKSPYILLFIDSHVLLLGGGGRVLCDTDKCGYSTKKVLKVYELSAKE